MRIGFDAKRAFQNSTGLGNYSRDVIRLFTYNLKSDHFFLFDPKGKGIHFDYNLFNTQVISSQRKTGIGKSVWRHYGLKKEVESLHLDVYHGLSNELPVGIEKAKVKTVVTIHDIIFIKHPEWYPKFDRNIYKKKVKRALKVADRVIAISEQTRKDLIDEFRADPSKIRVVYQGANPVFSEMQTPESLENHLSSFHLPEKFLLYVGTIEPRKNLHRLVEAIADLDIPLVVVGKKTDYFEKVNSAMHGKAIEKQFTHLTDITFQQLAALYQKAKLFAYPSLYEGFGIPIIESLNCGTPVLTGTGCLQEAAGKGGLSVDTTSVEAIREGIIKLWNDDELLSQMRVSGLEHVQRFRDEAIWNSWHEVYKNL